MAARPKAAAAAHGGSAARLERARADAGSILRFFEGLRLRCSRDIAPCISPGLLDTLSQHWVA
eukprot:1288191-Alexandrium_andersonii.AAC.1